MSVIGLKFWKNRGSLTIEENNETGSMSNKSKHSSKYGGAGDAPLTSQRQRNRTGSIRSGSWSAPPTSNLSDSNVKQIYLNTAAEDESPVYKSTTIPIEESTDSRRRFFLFKWLSCFNCSSVKEDDNKAP